MTTKDDVSFAKRVELKDMAEEGMGLLIERCAEYSWTPYKLLALLRSAYALGHRDGLNEAEQRALSYQAHVQRTGTP